jgi:hypothetical protein
MNLLQGVSQGRVSALVVNPNGWRKPRMSAELLPRDFNVIPPCQI